MKRTHTLIVLRDQGTEVRKFRLTSLQLQLVAFAVAAGFIGVAVSGWLFWTTRSDRRVLERIRSENQALRHSNEQIEQRIAALSAQLGETEERTRRLAIVAGLDSVSPPGEGGVGGGFPEPLTMGEQIGDLETRNQEVVILLGEIEQQLGENFKLVSSTPSITPVAGILSSRFGYRLDPFTGERSLHAGIDLSAPPGTPVHATAAGVVVRTLQGGPLGRSVTIAHGFGFSTLYGHLARIQVSLGQRVSRGQIVGLVGNSGRATGYHLHYEVHRHGRPVDPLQYMLDRRR